MFIHTVGDILGAVAISAAEKGDTCQHFRAAVRQPEYWEVGLSNWDALVHENKATENGGAGRNNMNQEMAMNYWL